MKKTGILITIIIMILVMAGCGKNETKEQKSVDISGSTSVETIAQAVGEEFMALNNVEFSYQGIGSSAGIKNAIDGVSDIGTASRNLKESEKKEGLKEVIIAYDGIAVIINPNNKISDLTTEQIRAIYKGEITNWSEVGGENAEIAVVSREDGSGTRGAFEEILDFEDNLTKSATLKDGNGNVQATVANNEQAIGYVSFTYIDDSIKPLKVNGVKATVQYVLDQSYKISRPFLMVYNEKNLSELDSKYIEFILSKEGQDIVEEHGGIRIDS